jgi:hypothetical protein
MDLLQLIFNHNFTNVFSLRQWEVRRMDRVKRVVREEEVVAMPVLVEAEVVVAAAAEADGTIDQVLVVVVVVVVVVVAAAAGIEDLLRGEGLGSHKDNCLKFCFLQKIFLRFCYIRRQHKNDLEFYAVF